MEVIRIKTSSKAKQSIEEKQMIVIFVKNNAYGENEDVIFLGCCNDMENL